MKCCNIRFLLIRKVNCKVPVTRWIVFLYNFHVNDKIVLNAGRQVDVKQMFLVVHSCILHAFIGNALYQLTKMYNT